MTRRAWMGGAAACALMACGSSAEPAQKDVGAVASAALVAPAPNGTDDTEVLQGALNGCIPGGPKCVVQLRAGTYKTKQLYASGFSGTLAGAGLDQTRIVALQPYVMGGPDQDPYAAPPDPDTNPQPHIVTFYDGADVRVRDLTFAVEAPNPAEPWSYGGCPTQGLKAAVSVTGSARIDRVGFRGVLGTTTWSSWDGEACSPFPAPNLDNGPMLSSSRPGEEFAIRASRFTALGNGFELFGIDRATVTVGGSPKEGNVFEAGSNAGALMYVGASNVRYAWNRATDAYAPWGWAVLVIANYGGSPVPYDAPSRFLVEHNTFSGYGEGMNGVVVDDRPGNPAAPSTIDLAFTNNVVDVHDALAWGLALRGLQAPLVANNTFTGEGMVGIFVNRTRGSGGSGGQLLTNDLTGFVAAPTPDDDLSAQIVLYAGAHDVLVDLSGQPTTVLDLGTNDRVVGAK